MAMDVTDKTSTFKRVSYQIIVLSNFYLNVESEKCISLGLYWAIVDLRKKNEITKRLTTALRKSWARDEKIRSWDELRLWKRNFLDDEYSNIRRKKPVNLWFSIRQCEDLFNDFEISKTCLRKNFKWVFILSSAWDR